MAASIQANLDFLDKCKLEIDAKRKRLINLEKNKPSPKQRSIEDEIAESANKFGEP
jgi:DNA-binding protein H-NS